MAGVCLVYLVNFSLDYDSFPLSFRKLTQQCLAIELACRSRISPTTAEYRIRCGDSNTSTYTTLSPLRFDKTTVSPVLVAQFGQCMGNTRSDRVVLRNRSDELQHPLGGDTAPYGRSNDREILVPRSAN